MLLTPEGADVSAISAALTATDAFQAALDLLTARGLAATPPFLLAEWDARGARLVVRGDATADVTTAGGSETVTGTGVSTWVERSLPGVTALQFSVPAAAAASGAALPLESGVVYAAGVRLDLSGLPALSVPPAEKDPTPAPPTVVAPPASSVVASPPIATQVVPVPVDVGATVRAVSDSEAEAPAEPIEPDASEATVHQPPPTDGLHDGLTVHGSAVKRLRKASRGSAPAPSGSEPTVDPAVDLVISTTGARERLAQPVLIGRDPSVSGPATGAIPRLVAVSSDKGISRTHAKFALEGGTVVVTDLHSANGTSIALPGKSPQKLRAGEPTPVIVGTVVDLGGVTVTVELAP
jgi:hypothetical protein